MRMRMVILRFAEQLGAACPEVHVRFIKKSGYV